MDLGIVIPTLNSERFLNETLQSVQGLRNDGANILIVDGGSKDGTLQIAKAFGVSVEYQQPGNMYAAINFGINLLEDKFITYINSDDLIYSDAGIEAMDAFSETADLIYGEIDYIDDEGRFLHSWRSPVPKMLNKINRFCNAIPQQGTIFRKTIWEKLNGFDTSYKYCADYDFFVRVSLESERIFKYKGNRIAAFRIHGRQLSQNSNGVNRREAEIIRERNQIPKATILNRLSLSLRNIDSYTIRLLRARQLRHRNFFRKTIE